MAPAATRHLRGRAVRSLIAGASTTASGARPEPIPVRIGVVGTLENDEFSARFRPTADDLSRAVPQYAFSIVPLRAEDLIRTAEEHEVDFVVASPGPYVALEVRGPATRVLTVVQHWHGKRYDQIGGVVFCRAEREDLQSPAGRGTARRFASPCPRGHRQTRSRRSLSRIAAASARAPRRDLAST
jgi:hypothetical protein